MWMLVYFPSLLIGGWGFGSDRQAVSAGARLAVLGSAREGRRALLGIEFGALQPHPSPSPRSLADPTQTRTAVMVLASAGAPRAGAREGPSRGCNEMKDCEGAFRPLAPANALPRCLLAARTADSRPSAPAHAAASSRVAAVSCRRSHARRRRAKFRQRVRGDAVSPRGLTFHR